ncbi:MAG: DUF4145 domain-containing protein [Gemmatimonas sp.]|nr:DUF4145 domain-containing protein [Gemmatimonas sp.]
MSYNSGRTGKCPHCSTAVRFEATEISARGGAHRRPLNPIYLDTPSRRGLEFQTSGCPACGLPIVRVVATSDPQDVATRVDVLLWPVAANRPVPPEVEEADPDLSEDFREAVGVFPVSKKASAALARRCLQRILTTRGGATGGDLASQIKSVIEDLPYELGLNVDAIRHVENFAAHPIKSRASGEITPVEDGEAEWLLNVLEELFEHYYVAPAQAASRREALNQKLEELGKPPLTMPGEESAAN